MEIDNKACVDVPAIIKSSIRSAVEGDQTAEAARILLKTDDFLLLFLSYLTNSKDTVNDPFLTSPKVVQSILSFSVRNFLIKSLAEEWAELAEKESSDDKIKQQRVKNTTSTRDTENSMIIILLHTFPKLMISSEYLSWCLRIKIAKNSESRMMRSVLEMRFESNNRSRYL